MTSFEFLTDHHIVLTCLHLDLTEEYSPQPPALVVVHIFAAHPFPVQLRYLKFMCMFQYPQLDNNSTPFHITVRSDPSPSWLPNESLSVPFHTSQFERLLVTTFWMLDAGNVLRSILLFVPSSTLVAHMVPLECDDGNELFIWEDWGREGTRMIEAPMGHSPMWASYVFGMNYLAPVWTGDRWGFQIFDFNRLGNRRWPMTANPSPIENEVLVAEESTLRADGRFREPVSTSLPYRCRQLRFSAPMAPMSKISWEGVLLSEDSIIAVGVVSLCPQKIHSPYLLRVCYKCRLIKINGCIAF